VDGAGRVDGCGTPPDRPGAHLVLSHRKEGHQPQQSVDLAHEAVQSRLRDVVGRQELGHLVRRELGDLHLQAGSQGQSERATVPARPTEVSGQGVVLAQVQHHERRLGGQKLKAPDEWLVIWRDIQVDNRRAGFQRGDELSHESHLAFEQRLLGRTGLSEALLDPLDAALDDGQI